jgi:hypothetical protein
MGRRSNALDVSPGPSNWPNPRALPFAWDATVLVSELTRGSFRLPFGFALRVYFQVSVECRFEVGPLSPNASSAQPHVANDVDVIMLGQIVPDEGAGENVDVPPINADAQAEPRAVIPLLQSLHGMLGD